MLSMLPPYSAFLWLAQRLTRQIRSPASSETTIDPSGSSLTSTGRPTPLRKLCPLPERLLHTQPHDLVPDRDAAVPAPVFGNQRFAAQLRKHGTAIEVNPERGDMGLELIRGWGLWRGRSRRLEARNRTRPPKYGKP